MNKLIEIGQRYTVKSIPISKPICDLGFPSASL